MEKISKNLIIMSAIASLLLLISCSSNTADSEPEETNEPIEKKTVNPSGHAASSEKEE